MKKVIVVLGPTAVGKTKIGIELAKRLIELGADINTQGQRLRGYTALHAAIENRKIDATRLLLEHNANPNIQDAFGNIPLMKASHLDIEIL